MRILLKKKVDYEYLDNQYKLILSNISKDLNHFHKTNYNIRYWKLLMVHYSNTFTYIL